MKENYSKVHFENSQNHFGFEIRDLDYIYKHPKREQIQQAHQIDFYIIIYITEGYGTHNIDFKQYPYRKGSVLFIAKNQVHAFIFNNRAKGYVLIFTEEFLNQNQIRFNDLSFTYPFNFALYHSVLQIDQYHENFLSLFEFIYQEYNPPILDSSEEILQCLLRTVLLKIRSYNDDFEPATKNISKSSTETFIRFQQLLDQHINKRNANFYCDKLGISYKVLNDTSKELTGITIKKFIDKNLMIKAKQRLSLGNLNIAEISYLLGFEEATNFTKFFKKQTNLSPSEFQKELIVKK